MIRYNVFYPWSYFDGPTAEIGGVTTLGDLNINPRLKEMVTTDRTATVDTTRVQPTPSGDGSGITQTGARQGIKPSTIIGILFIVAALIIIFTAPRWMKKWNAESGGAS